MKILSFSNTGYPLIILLLFFICASCRHPDPPEPLAICQYDARVEELKKWYYFKEGTQWIYQDENSGEKDTAAVYESHDGDSSFNYYVLHSKGGWIVNYYFDPSLSIECLSSMNCLCHKVVRARFKPGDYVGEGRLFVFPHILGNYTYSDGGACQVMAVSSSLSLDGHDYVDVAEWDIPIDASENDEHTHYWIARNAGIVRMSNDAGGDWRLISSIIYQ